MKSPDTNWKIGLWLVAIAVLVVVTIIACDALATYRIGDALNG